MPFWGQGYATEAARAVIDYAFEEFGSTELRAGARVVNPASRRVLEKCGFQWTNVQLLRVAIARLLGAGRPLQARPRCLVVAEELAGRRAGTEVVALRAGDYAGCGVTTGSARASFRSRMKM